MIKLTKINNPQVCAPKHAASNPLRGLILAFMVLAAGGVLCVNLARTWALPELEAERRVTLPTGTMFAVLLNAPLDSREITLDQPVCGQLINDIYIDRLLVLKAHSQVCGIVSTLHPPIEGRDTIIEVQFGTLEAMTPWGLQAIAFKGHLKTDRPDHLLGGWLTPGSKPRRVPFYVTMLGDYAKAIWDRSPRLMGRPIIFDAGARWEVILDEPLVLPPELPATGPFPLQTPEAVMPDTKTPEAIPVKAPSLEPVSAPAQSLTVPAAGSNTGSVVPSSPEPEFEAF
ncbi:MAG: hypothetical protein VKJ06_01675 [Vampirovibrionales bacterium]|nr:hypothetical protein [Vampirovibrionales bacterium]